MEDIEITKREVIASISIVAIMLIIGVLISTKLSENIMDKNEKYNKAINIEETEIFKYGMRTDVGNAFVYGELKAVDPVTYDEIGEKYMYIKKVKEKYTQHTRVVTYRSGGHTRTRTETYWSWDKVGTESKKCKKIMFCNVEFNSNKIEIPSAEYIKTIKESYFIRYKYYGTSVKSTGTIFTKLKKNTISNNSRFYENKKIQETKELVKDKHSNIIFWVFWIILTVVIVIGFYYLENEWLE